MRPHLSAVSASAVGSAGPLRSMQVGGRLTQQAYQQLRSRILKGDLRAGTLLTEGSLALTLGMSKTPVRQALRSLLHEGLLQTGPNRQLMVRGFSSNQRDELINVREALETIAIRQACKSMPIDEIDYLHILLMRQKRAADGPNEERFIELDEELHLRIAAGAGLYVVPKILQELRGFVRIMRIGTVRHPSHLQQVLAEHEAIVRAIEDHDEEAAIAALTTHLHTVEYTTRSSSNESLGKWTSSKRRRK